ncbi:hypothetical protein Tco_1509961 [Tanacetum coccineum]
MTPSPLPHIIDRIGIKMRRDLEDGKKLLFRAKEWFHAGVRQTTPPGLTLPRVNVNTGHGNVSTVSSAGTQIKSGSSRFNTGKQHVNSGSVHVNSGTQIKSGSSRFNTGKQTLILGHLEDYHRTIQRWDLLLWRSKGSNSGKDHPKRVLLVRDSDLVANSDSEYAAATLIEVKNWWLPISGRRIKLMAEQKADNSGYFTTEGRMYYLEFKRMLQAQLGHEKGHASCHLLIGCKLVEIVDFLRRSKLRYALTHNPPIYDSLVKQFWQTATARTLADGTQQLNATIDSIEYTITEESVRRQLQLADASGINIFQK